MNNNANILYQINEARALIGAALSIQPRAAGGESGETPDDIVSALATSIRKELPDDLNVEKEAGNNTFLMEENGLMNSLATFFGARNN